MKRCLLFLIALFLLLSLTACQTVVDPSQTEVEIDPDMLGPLFRIKATPTQTGPQTKYYPTESGIAYVSVAERGYMGGYFMLPNLISNEAIFTCNEEPSAIFDIGREQAVCFADGKLFLLDLQSGSSTSFHLSGKMEFEDILLGADGAFYYVNEGYLLTSVLEFNDDYSDLSVTEYVVMPTKMLPGFVSLLGVTSDGTRCYYTYELEGEEGYGYFYIGKQGALYARNPLSHQAIQRVSGTDVVLFESPLSAGKKTYTRLFLDSGESEELVVPAGNAFDSVRTNRMGTHLVGLQLDDDGYGGVLELYEFGKAERLKSYTLAELVINESIAVTSGAKYLIVGQYDNGASYEDAGGETVTRIEVDY